MRGLRVLHVLDKISVESGVSSVVMNYYDKLDHNKLTFDFMLNEEVDAKTMAYIKGNGSKIYIMPALRIANVFKYRTALKEFYKSHDYKIVHGHVANSAVFYLGLAKNVPYRIIHSHSTKSSEVFWKRVRNRILIYFIKHVANRYVACSSEAAKFLFGKNSMTTILNNAIDVEKFAFNNEVRAEMRAKMGFSSEFVIGHVGRFSEAKNHLFLLDVFYELNKKNTNTRLILIGDGELYPDVVRKTEMLGLEETVLFLGVTDDIGAYMNAMDIFVLPSLFEGLGLVGVEAQASGLRVLASKGIPATLNVTEAVEFLSLDKSLWVHKLLSMPEIHDRTKLGNKVKGSRFDIEIQVDSLCKYYESLLEVI